MKEPKFKTDGLLLKGLLALSISATPMLTWAGSKPAEASLTTATPKVNAVATTAQRAQATTNTIKGVVKDAHGEPLIGVSVLVKGTGKGSVTNIDGEYTVAADGANPTLVFSYVGYQSQEVAVGNRRVVDVTMQDDSKVLGEVVVTAMGIQRKAESLTYSTQRVKAEDLMKVQDPNVANTLEGKVAGVTITPSAGGAGGSSKIILRGNKSILGNSSPLIVVDGIPMSNGTRGRRDMSGEGFTYSGMSEGSDPLSMINPDDIESINVLKGANAAALYGSQAGSGVLMITTKKGREGRLDVNFTSNVTFDTPLLTPKIQDVYGATMSGNSVSPDGWGAKIGTLTDSQLNFQSPLNSTNFENGATTDIHMRNYSQDEVKKFFRTGVTTNNSVSLSGGTEKMSTYFSMSNSHALGMMRNNNYNRNTLNLRQSYKFFNRLKIDISLNYAQTVTKNRPGGGTVGNPLYHLYLAPRNVDMNYYRDNYVTQNGTWLSHPQKYYDLRQNGYVYNLGQARLSGPRQNWAFMNSDQNNPYWLTGMNDNKNKEDRIWGTVAAVIDIYDGLSFQARANYDQIRYHSTSRQYATTFLPSVMNDYGRFWDSEDKRTEIYVDYLLNYNKQFGDFDVSGTAGWVGHTVKGEYKGTDAVATYVDRTMQSVPTRVNYFDVGAGGMGTTSSSKSSNWDRSWLVTGQVGWKETVFFDASYRRDWYRPYRLLKQYGQSKSDNYGYFGFGANAIIGKLVKLPKELSYLKYRVSYSEVGNSIPNNAFNAVRTNLQTGAVVGSNYNELQDAKPEIVSSIETGFESLWFNNRLSFDLTYYNATTKSLYMTIPAGNGKTKVLNSAKIRNQGFEATIGYDFKPVKWLRWRTSYNLSYNKNKILKTALNSNGEEALVEQVVAGTHVKYMVGGSIGDMYVPDYSRDANGHIKLNSAGQPMLDTSGKLKYVGNMNANWQMGWSNTFNYKDFSLAMLINGRIGGKVISLTEQRLDYYGFSQRSAGARLNAERNNIVAKNYGNVPGIELPDGSGRIVPVRSYYEAMGNANNPESYIYNATNFRMRELSLGYTFRDLLGSNKNLSLSFIARNLFFIYKDAPVDPDVSLSTQNGLGAFELFNMPSSRSYGFSMKLNF
jgi:tonB-linked outer membrane protein, susC/ragA family